VPQLRGDLIARLRPLLASTPGVQVLDNRVILRGDALFAGTSATLSPAGKTLLHTLATELKGAAVPVPSDSAWLLQVEGHADKKSANPLDISVNRALSVVRALTAEGIALKRLAAEGFGDGQPVDTAETAEALAKNRRIELRLTDR